MELALLTGWLAAGLRLSMSIGIAALGETVAQRSGMINVGIEGIMLVGAFLAAFGALSTGSPWGGLALALLGGVVLASIQAWFIIVKRTDQIVTGIAFVILGLGLSGFLFRIAMGGAPSSLPSFRPLDLGPLTALPVLGPVLFGQNIVFYLALLAALAIWIVMTRTRLGLAIRACGENPIAADAAGIRVNRVRAGCMVFGGAMASLGGAYLAIAQISSFVEDMVAGRGFLAIACVVFGRWHPIGVLVAAITFGLAEAAQIRLQTWFQDVPYQFFLMLPYVLGIAALAVMARSVALPKALGTHFQSQRRR